MKIATAAYPLDWHGDWASFEAKVTQWVEDAADNGADLLVFPEYGAMELASLGGKEKAADLEAALGVVSEHADDMIRVFSDLARVHGVHILAPSLPAFTDPDRRPVNRAVLIGPDGTFAHQDKQIMTRFEREVWHVRSGDPLTVFDTALGRIGVLICYDAEFPLLGRALFEQGVEILLVPSCTDGLAGYWRVRVGAMARALEGQCVVVQSPTVGDAAWCPAIDENVGAAAIYGPPDLGFPPTGVIAEGTLNEAGWVYADVDLQAVRTVRMQGQVLNQRHWPEQALRITSVTTHRIS